MAIALALSLAKGADWPAAGGNAQHNGWAASERQLTRANVGELKLLYRYQPDNPPGAYTRLTAPILVGNLITYLGFKEMLMFSAGSNTLFSVDADLNRLIWETHLASAGSQVANFSATAVCPGGMTAPLVTAGSSSSSLHFAALASQSPAVPGVPRPRPNPYLPPLSQTLYPMLPTTLTKLNSLYTVTADGYLHIVNSSTGQDLISPVRFIPAGARITSLNLRDNVVYATTGGNCDGFRNSLFALDLLSPQKNVSSFSLLKGDFAGSGGITIGNDGLVYLQGAYSPDGDPKHTMEAVIALTPKDLQVKDYFWVGKAAKVGEELGSGITPAVFSGVGRDLLIAAGRDGRVCLLDSRSLGGTDHKTPLFVHESLARNSKKGTGFRGTFSNWLDVESGVRRFYAPFFGEMRMPSGAALSAGAGDSVVSFALTGTAEQPTLQPLWTASGLDSPAPVVIGNGMVFVLSTGDPPLTQDKKGRPFGIPQLRELAKPATLHVFDAATGKNLYTGPAAPVSASASAGMALANGRIYFSGRDNAVYCLGIPAQHSQLSEQ